MAAADAIYAVNPNVLFFIEGTGQQGIANNWGDGVATDRSAIAAAGVSDPNPFFTTLMSRPYLSQVPSCSCYHICRLVMTSPYMTSAVACISCDFQAQNHVRAWEIAAFGMRTLVIRYSPCRKPLLMPNIFCWVLYESVPSYRNKEQHPRRICIV